MGLGGDEKKKSRAITFKLDCVQTSKVNCEVIKNTNFLDNIRNAALTQGVGFLGEYHDR